MSVPSMAMRPSWVCRMRSRLRMVVDLPLPVRPTTPIFSRSRTLRLTPFSTRSNYGRYRTEKSSN